MKPLWVRLRSMLAFFVVAGVGWAIHIGIHFYVLPREVRDSSLAILFIIVYFLIWITVLIRLASQFLLDRCCSGWTIVLYAIEELKGVGSLFCCSLIIKVFQSDGNRCMPSASSVSSVVNFVLRCIFCTTEGSEDTEVGGQAQWGETYTDSNVSVRRNACCVAW
jgi:hypothetical protein